MFVIIEMDLWTQYKIAKPSIRHMNMHVCLSEVYYVAKNGKLAMRNNLFSTYKEAMKAVEELEKAELENTNLKRT